MLSGTFELFALADVLGLVERAEASGALVVRGREVDGTLYFANGQLVGGEIGDLSGPVEDRQDLFVRLLEVMVPLLRARSADFAFSVDVTPPWPAPLAITIAEVLAPAERTAREWASIMTAIESFESSLERTGQITTDTITLSHLGFRVLELVDGALTIRELAHRAGASLVAVAPEVRALVLSGAVRVVVGSERALATARADAIRDRPRADALLDVTDAERAASTPDVLTPEREPEPVPSAPDRRADPMPAVPVAAVPPPLVDPAEELARTRADLAARAGLGDPGPVPEPVAPAAEEHPERERAQIVVDRSELLRMFSGLKDE